MSPGKSTIDEIVFLIWICVIPVYKVDTWEGMEIEYSEFFSKLLTNFVKAGAL